MCCKLRLLTLLHPLFPLLLCCVCLQAVLVQVAASMIAWNLLMTAGHVLQTALAHPAMALLLLPSVLAGGAGAACGKRWMHGIC
jgi:hypothetical protein